MKSIGLLFERQRLFLVCLKKGIKGISLHHYRLLSLKNVKPEEKEDLIASSIEGFLKESRFRGKNLFLGLPRDQVVFKYLDMPIAIEENLRNALQYEMDRYTPFTADDVYLDYQIISRDKERQTLRLLLIAVKKELLDNYLMILERLNIRPRGAEITSTSLFNLQYRRGERKLSLPIFPLEKVKNWFKREEDKEKSEEKQGEKKGLKRLLAPFLTGKAEKEEISSKGLSAVSYLDENYFELDIIQDGILTYSKACTLLCPKGTDRVSFLNTSITFELEMAAMSLSGLKGETLPLVLTGSELDSGLIEELKLTGDVQPEVIHEIGIRVKEGKDRDLLPLLSPAIGVAIKGLREVPLDINLIPLNLRPREIKYLKQIIAGFLLLLSSITGGVYYYNAVIEEETHLDKLTKDVNQLRIEVLAVEKMQKEAEEIRGKIHTIEEIKKRDISKIAIMKELTTIVPLDAWLTDFSYREKERKIELSGFAFFTSNLISILEESPLLEKVQFTSPIVKGASVKENFRLEAVVTSQEKK
jgi:Tfp pilus assembly protein PilN